MTELACLTFAAMQKDAHYIYFYCSAYALPPIPGLPVLKKYTLSLQEKWSEGIKSASCCAALIPCAPGNISPSSALDLAQISCFLILESSKKKNFFIFKAGEESVTYKYAD